MKRFPFDDAEIQETSIKNEVLLKWDFHILPTSGSKLPRQSRQFRREDAEQIIKWRNEETARRKLYAKTRKINEEKTLASGLPDQLFNYAIETYKKDGEFPNVRDAAKHFKCSQKLIVQAVNDYAGNASYFDLNIGVAIAGGGGHAELPRGEWEIEAWEN